MKSFERILLIFVVVLLGALAIGAAQRPVAIAPADPDALRIATCDMLQLAEELMNDPRFKDELDQKHIQLGTRLEPLGKKLDDLQKRWPNDMTDEERAQLDRKLKEAQRIFLETRQELQFELQSFTASQLARAFDMARSSAEAIAEDEGYTHVFNSRRDEGPVVVRSPERILESLMTRVVVVGPKEDDMTDLVREDLKLD